MKRLNKFISLILAAFVVSLSNAVCYAEDEGKKIPDAIELNAAVYSQRADGVVFENPKQSGLILGMVEDELGEDGTPVLSDKGWYLYETDTPMVSSAKKSDKNKDYSSDKAFAFNNSKFYYWFHAASDDPLSEIVRSAMTVIEGEADEEQKLYALAAADYAMQLASSQTAAGFDIAVNSDSLQKGGKIYPATELAFAVNNILQSMYAASSGGAKLSDMADEQIKKVYESLKSEYAKSKNKDSFFNDKIEKLTEVGVYDMRLSAAVGYTFELTANGEESELADGSKSYTYSFDSPAFYPVGDSGFYQGSVQSEPLFTMHFDTDFVYHGGEVFSVSGNDDIWVFVNGHLVLDMGGVHSVILGEVELDSVAEELGIKQGDVCKLSFFYANRRSSGSSLSISTTILPTELTYVGEGQTANGQGDGQKGLFGLNNRTILIGVCVIAVVLLFLIFTDKGKRKKSGGKRGSSQNRDRKEHSRERHSDKEREKKPRKLDEVKSLDDLYGDLEDFEDDDASDDKDSEHEEKPRMGNNSRGKKEDGRSERKEEEVLDISGSIYDDSDISFLLDDIPSVDDNK